MFSTPTKRVRTITRSAIATAMVAPILTFGAQAAMAGGDPDPVVGNVKTEVVYDCTGGNVTFYPLLTNTSATQAVQITVESVDTDELVFFKSLDFSNQYGSAITVPLNHSYEFRVVEVDGPGVPGVLSYQQLFVIPKNCSTDHNFKIETAALCDGLTPMARVNVINTGDTSDAYTVSATFNGNGYFQTQFVVPSGATKTVTFPVPATLTAGIVSSNTEADTKDFGPIQPEPCAIEPSDQNPAEGPKGAPAPVDPTPVPQDTVPPSTPDSGTTGTKPTLPPPATVPPTVVTVPPMVVPDTVPATTKVVPTIVTSSTLPIEIGTPPVFVDEIPEIEDLGIPVHVLGEIATAQPAQAGADTPLAFTGTSSTTLAGAAAALMATGAAIVLAARRRRHA